jgi:hypothetical protein
MLANPVKIHWQPAGLMVLQTVVQPMLIMVHFTIKVWKQYEYGITILIRPLLG